MFKILLTTSMIASIHSFADKMAVSQFSIQTYQHQQKKSLNQENQARKQQPAEIKHHKGIFFFEEDFHLNTIKMSLVFIELNQTDFKHSKVLKMVFPFNFSNPALLGREVTLSPSALNQSYTIPETAAEFYEVGQGVYLGNGKRIYKEAKVNYLKVKIFNETDTEINYTEAVFKSLELGYQEGDQIRVLRIKEGVVDRTDPTTPQDLVLFLTGVLMVLLAPILFLVFGFIIPFVDPPNNSFFGLILFSSSLTAPLLATATLAYNVRSQDIGLIIFVLNLR